MKQTPISDFSYTLPEEYIAQKPVEPRDQAKLMVMDRKTGATDHRHVFDLPDLLKSGDILVLNDTKVFKARLYATVEKSGTRVEVFLVRHVDGETWEVFLEPGRRAKVDARLLFSDGMTALVTRKNIGRWTANIRFNATREDVLAFADTHGSVPLPPYVTRKDIPLSQYQTVFADQTGSVAAPTAGLHFTPRLLQTLKQRGVQIEYVTLHVGLGTFQPIKTETVEAHRMHAESVSISAQTAQCINRAKQDGQRVFAVGTTVVRTLEGAAQEAGSPLPTTGFSGEVDLFIRPGYQFRVIDAMMTNFHLPQSSLLVLVSAFAGRERVLHAYQEAMRKHYRFYSFGDAMIIQ